MAEAGRHGPLEVDTASCGVPPVLDSRFTDVRPLGYGASGVVYSGRQKTGDKHEISIKRVALHDQRSLRQALREIKVLRKLKHDNIIALYQVLDANGAELKLDHHSNGSSSPASLRTVYFIQELMHTSLKHLISSSQLTAAHVRLLSYQMLRGLKYLHSANVLHRDLKPANLFVNCDTLLLKIGDFGTSRIVDPNYNHDGHLTPHVTTPWYRSPEALLSPRSYSRGVDVWAAGCVLAEALSGVVLLPGQHHTDQLLRILDTVTLADRDWDAVLRVTPNKLLKNHPFRPRRPLRGRLADLHPHAVDVIEAMLTFDPALRVSAGELLSHPYFDLYSCSRDEPSEPRPFHIEDEVDDLPLSVLQRLFLHESISDPGVSMATFPQHPPITTATLPQHPGITMTTLPEPPVPETTHTLEEIFKLSSHRGTPAAHTTSQAGSSGHVPSHDLLVTTTAATTTTTKNRPETPHERLENQRNTENTLRNSPSSGVISHSLTGGPKKGTDDEKDSDDEKEVADCSPSKIREDLELGIHQILNRAQALAIDVEELGMKAEEMLVVEIDETENFKEFANPSPKELSPNHQDDFMSPRQQHFHQGEIPPRPTTPPLPPRSRSRPGTPLSGATAASRRSPIGGDQSWQESFKKQRLKQDTKADISRKLLLDKIECEKKKERDAEVLSNEELDNLYRLPTDHLALDRDLTHQRLKQQRGGRLVARRYSSLGRHDRTNEDKLYHVEGACGGYEHSPDNSDHSETDDIIQNILGDSGHTGQPHHAILSADIDISLDVSNIPVNNSNNNPRDPLSSPESPPSPNNTRAGARPKKSPKKQRAT